jgi:CheY-like chemotaxis protein
LAALGLAAWWKASAGARATEGPAAAEGKPPQPEAVPRLKPPCRILLVEDGPENQRLISFILNKAGAEVTVASNGQEALEIASAIAPGAGSCEPSDAPSFDVILMDLQMPVMDGYEATRRLREAGYEGPIIAISAHAMSIPQQKALDAGCDHYLSKPIDRARLIATIQRYLEPATACF